MGSIIEVKGLTKRFGENIILDNINFDIEEGSVFGLIGRSGCGKTTLLNMLVGFLKPNKGNILFRGKEISKLGNKLGINVGLACQGGSFYNELSVHENLAYFGRLYGLEGKDIKERTGILLNTFGLMDALNTLGQNLSIGMQKRLDIACSLIHDPEVLILDEPTANLDPVLRKNILDLIKKINESGTTVIISSHILDDISTLCNKVLVIDNKRIIGLDSPHNLELKLSKSDVIKLESELCAYDGVVAALLSNGAIDNYQLDGASLLLFTKDTKNALKHINSYYSKEGDQLVQINIVKPSLGHIFDVVVDNEKN